MELCVVFTVIFFLVNSSSLVSSRRSPSTNAASSSSSSPSSSSSIASIFNFGTMESNRRRGVAHGQLPTSHKRLRHGFSKEFKGRKHNFMKAERKPNIILIITDDQDVVLRSMDHMPKALRVLKRGGVHFRNAFVTTPMCCPSRSSILTGMYIHNHHVYTNNDNCSSRFWQQTMETRSFATYLNNVGYRTGFFGKYLNEYNGSYIPPGWREWSGLIRNSRFYNYTVNFNGNKRRHGDDYHKDYYPDLITNESIAFFRQSKQLFVNKPVMMVLSYPSPHGPEDAAPQFQNAFPNVTTHRTDSWDYAPNYDKQWILRETGKMEPIHQKFTDALHRKRLQTLLSVDDAVDRIYNELRDLGELNNTYIVYTSDHGYHLGQFGLVKGKAMPFDFDIRVPFYVRGPRVPRGVNISNIVLNLDIAPTLLDMAGIEVPEHMDGKSILKLIDGAEELQSNKDNTNVESQLMNKRTWRDTFLVESAGRQNAGSPNRRKKPPKSKSFSIPFPDRGNKDYSRLGEVCKGAEYKFPCSPLQRWSCFFNGKRWRMQKCRPRNRWNFLKNRCVCSSGNSNSTLLLDHTERRRQRTFLKHHVGKDFKPHFIRGRRSPEDFDVNEIFELHRILELKYEFPELLVVDSYSNSSNQKDAVFPKTTRSTRQQPISKCKMKGSVVNCSDDVYNNPGAWRENKHFVDNQIKILKIKLDELKDIRKHLKLKRPGDGVFGSREKNTQHYDSNYDDDGSGEELESIDGRRCICDDSYIKRNGHRRGGEGANRDERRRIKEELRRQKEERQRRLQEKLKRQERKSRRKHKYGNYTCNIEKMNCFVHDNDHWKTPPFWTDGPFCFCQNSNNNTYWCLRTINATHDFLYCEFITGFISFFDMKVDPHQLQNVIEDVPFAVLDQLHQQLMKMRACQGAKECTVRSRIRGSHFTQPQSEYGDDYDNARQGRFLPTPNVSSDREKGKYKKLLKSQSKMDFEDNEDNIDNSGGNYSGWTALHS